MKDVEEERRRAKYRRTAAAIEGFLAEHDGPKSTAASPEERIAAARRLLDAADEKFDFLSPALQEFKKLRDLTTNAEILALCKDATLRDGLDEALAITKDDQQGTTWESAFDAAVAPKQRADLRKVPTERQALLREILMLHRIAAGDELQASE